MLSSASTTSGTTTTEYSEAPDPFRELFGDLGAADLFGRTDMVVRHRKVTDFPELLRTGPLATVRALCEAYRGDIEVASGPGAVGFQSRLAGLRPQAALKLGLTVYFKQLEAALEPSGPWLRAMERAAGAPTGGAHLGAFANPMGSGLPIHHDQHDQLLIHLEGEKLFHHRPNQYAQTPRLAFTPPMPQPPAFGQTYQNSFPDSTAELMEDVQTVRMVPGTVIYMPAGLWHTTEGVSEHGLSISVAFMAATQADVLLTYLGAYLHQSERWRRINYGGWSSDARAQEQIALLHKGMDELAKHLEHLSADSAFATSTLFGFLSDRHAQYPGDHPWDRFIRLPEAACIFEENANPELITMVVNVGWLLVPRSERRVESPIGVRPIVAWILASHGVFTVQQMLIAFPQITEHALRSMLDHLGRAQLIRPVPVPEFMEVSE